MHVCMYVCMYVFSLNYVNFEVKLLTAPSEIFPNSFREGKSDSMKERVRKESGNISGGLNPHLWHALLVESSVKGK